MTVQLPTPPLTVRRRASPCDGGWRSIARGDQRWQCAADWEDRLFDADGLRLGEWQAAGRLRVIKTGPHRTVWHTAAAGGIYIKQYRVSGWLGTLQHLIRPTRAELEWDAARRVSEAGIATFESLAVGVARRGWRVTDGWLVTREIAGVCPVDEFVEAIRHRDDRASRRIRTQLATRLGEIVARLHRAGLLHRDLHAGNFLIRIEADESVSLWLIDLHAVGAERRLSLRDIEWNLSQLNNFFVGRASDSERLRFLRAWHNELATLAPPLRKGGQGGSRSNRSALHRHEASDTISALGSLRESIQRFARYCETEVLETYRRGDEKWRCGNRRLILADNRTTRCRGLSILGREFVTTLRDRPAEALAGLESQVVHFPAPTTWSGRLALRFVSGPAGHAWEMGHALVRRGIPAVVPLAFVEPRDAAAPSSLLVERDGDSMTLRELLAFRASRGTWLTVAEEGHLIERLARSLHRLNRLEFFHRGLSVDNIRVAPTDLEMQLDGLSEIDHVGRVASRVAVDQLALLAKSARLSGVRLAERMRFLRSYVGRRLRSERKTLWKEIGLKLEWNGCADASSTDGGSAEHEPPFRVERRVA